MGERGGNVASLVGLFSVVAVNDVDDFFLFFDGNTDSIKCFTSSAVRADLDVVSS